MNDTAIPMPRYVAAIVRAPRDTGITRATWDRRERDHGDFVLVDWRGWQLLVFSGRAVFVAPSGASGEIVPIVG